MQKKAMVDYRKFRLSKINTPEFSHLKMLIFWPLFGLMFLNCRTALDQGKLLSDFLPVG